VVPRLAAACVSRLWFEPGVLGRRSPKRGPKPEAGIIAFRRPAKTDGDERSRRGARGGPSIAVTCPLRGLEGRVRLSRFISTVSVPT
jgi:hypothetical protein